MAKKGASFCSHKLQSPASNKSSKNYQSVQIAPQTNYETEHSLSTISLRQLQGENKEAKQDYEFNMDLFKDINEMDDEDYLNGMDKIIKKPQSTVVM